MSNNGIGHIKVAVYSRVSTQEQAMEGTSLDFQQTQMELFCKLQGWRLPKYIQILAITGKDDKRPGLTKNALRFTLNLFNRTIVSTS